MIIQETIFTIDLKNKSRFTINRLSGAGGSRTRVQTYSPKAFYMLISLLFVGIEQEMNKPILYLAAWSFVAGTACCNSILFCF